jgi:uncharacterized protein YecE (DUF72 family)
LVSSIGMPLCTENSNRSAKLYVGTSGWTYSDWRGRFYPKDIAQKNWLAWYVAHFGSVEINGSFYRTPSIEAVEQWRARTPSHFRFAWKASKFITHWKRLGSNSENSIALMESRLAALGSKCRIVLFQLPSRFHANCDLLSGFLEMLPSQYHYAFEFRHKSWYEAPILDLLRRYDVALCLSDHHEAPTPWIATSHYIYIRGHGPTGRYRGSYSDETLRTWAKHVRRWRSNHEAIYIFFDNDQKSAAPKDAKRLMALL